MFFELFGLKPIRRNIFYKANRHTFITKKKKLNKIIFVTWIFLIKFSSFFPLVQVINFIRHGSDPQLSLGIRITRGAF